MKTISLYLYYWGFSVSINKYVPMQLYRECEEIT